MAWCPIPWRVLGALLAALAHVPAGVPAAHAESPPPDTLIVYTEAWTDYTERDGSGFAWDILRAVYQPAGITIEKHFVPFARAVRMVTEGRGDAYPGAYRDGSAGSIYPELPYDTDTLAVLCRRERAAAWQGAQSLETGVVSWIIGYRLDAYLAPDMQVERAKTRTQALRMLKHGRIAYYLDARYEIRHLLEDPPIALDRSRYAWREAAKIPMYVAFDDSPRGRHFRAIWNTRFRKLLHAGTIAAIYDRYGFDVWPFAHPRDPPGT